MLAQLHDERTLHAHEHRAMTDRRIVTMTLDAIDQLVADLRDDPAWACSRDFGRDPVRLVVDEGRAAAEWVVRFPQAGRIAELAIVVVCDVDDGRITAARLYSAPAGAPRPAV